MRQAVSILSNVACVAATDANATSSALGVTIVRCINVTNTAAASGTFSLALTAGATSATAANCDFFTVSVASNTTQPFYGYWILPASTVVHYQGSAITIHITVTGDLSVAGG